MTAGFSLVALLMVQEVWRFYFDASRALVPLMTVYVLATAVSLARKGEGHVPPALEESPNTALRS